MAAPEPRRLLVLTNPRAGGGRAELLWQRLRLQDRSLGQGRLASATVVTGATAEEARRGLDRRLAPGLRLVVVGGDGTFHLAANRVLASGLGEAVELALIPAGTGSDLARGLGLPRRPEAALELALDGEARPFDALEVKLQGQDSSTPSRVFSVNIASAGVSGLVDELVARAASGSPNGARRATAYLWASLQAVRRYRPVVCQVRVDGTLVHDGPLFLLAVANGRFFGAGMKVAPQARPDDGQAQVVIVRPFPRWQLPLRMAQLFLGAHGGARAVSMLPGKRVELVARAALPPLDLDGDPYPATGASFVLKTGSLRVVR